MANFLALILANLQTAKDLLTTEGPQTLETVADILASISEGTRNAAAFLAGFAKQPQMAPGGTHAAPVAEKLAALKTLKAEVDDLVTVPPGSAAAMMEGGLLGGGGKGVWLKLIAEILAKVLAGAGGA